MQTANIHLSFSRGGSSLLTFVWLLLFLSLLPFVICRWRIYKNEAISIIHAQRSFWVLFPLALHNSLLGDVVALGGDFNQIRTSWRVSGNGIVCLGLSASAANQTCAILLHFFANVRAIIGRSGGSCFGCL
jgi:hypothetical protein